MGSIKRLILTGILLSSAIVPTAVYFSKHNQHQHHQQSFAQTHLQGPQTTNTMQIKTPQTPIRHVSKFIPLQKANHNSHKGNQPVDATIYIRPVKSVNYFHYNFVGIDHAYIVSGHNSGKTIYKQVKNDYVFGEKSAGKIEVNARNLDKVKVTTHITAQKDSTGSMDYIRKPMLDLKTEILNKKVLMTSVVFTFQVRGLATCPTIGFFVDYKQTGDGKSLTNIKLGMFSIYSMDHSAAKFFSSWFFLIFVFFVIAILFAVILFLLPASTSFWGIALAGFVGFVESVANVVWTTIGFWWTITSFEIFPWLGWFSHISFRNAATNQSPRPWSRTPWFGGEINPRHSNNWTSRFGGDILNYEANRYKSTHPAKNDVVNTRNQTLINNLLMNTAFNSNQKFSDFNQF